MFSITSFIVQLCAVLQSANVNSIIMKSDKKFGCSLKSKAALGKGGGRNFYNGINTTTRVFTGPTRGRTSRYRFPLLYLQRDRWNNIRDYWDAFFIVKQVEPTKLE